MARIAYAMLKKDSAARINADRNRDADDPVTYDPCGKEVSTS
jgi:hypothetical protein